LYLSSLWALNAGPEEKKRGWGGGGRNKIFPNIFHLQYLNTTNLVDKFHVKICLNLVIWLAAAPEHKLMSLKKVFTRNLGLN